MKKLGKNIILSLLAVLALNFAACSSDDNDSTSNGNDPQPQPQPKNTEIEVTKEEDLPFVNVLDEDFDASNLLLNQLFGANSAEDEVLQTLDDMRNQTEQDVLDLLSAINGDNGIEDLLNFNVAKITVKYWSVDGNGNPIQLSGDVYLPKAWGRYIDCKDILLSCHPTALMDMMITMFSMRSHVADQVVVIEPHYIGFGETKDMSQTYLCQKLIAQQCADMIPAAMKVLEQKEVKLASGYGTYVAGYSQGGGNAFAVGRYLETEASDEMKKLANLKKVVCGAGPYDPMATFRYWLQTDRLSLTMVLPMVIKGMMEGHSDIMKGIALKSYFSDLYLSTGIVDEVDNHQLGLDLMLVDMSSELESIRLEKCEGSQMFYWMRFSGIMSDEVKDPNSHIRKALEESMSMEVLTDWVPTVPVVLFTSTKDNVIPIEANAQAAYNKMKAAGAKNVTLIMDDFGDHIAAQTKFFEYLTNQGYRE